MDRFRNTGQPDWDWWGRVWPTPGATLRQLGLVPGDRVVEIGSGNGYFALPAARIADPATVYAVDVDRSLLAELDALATEQGIDNITAIKGTLGRSRSCSPSPWISRCSRTRFMVSRTVPRSSRPSPLRSPSTAGSPW